MIFAGWSARRRETAAYYIGITDEDGIVPFKLKQIQGLVGLPPPAVMPPRSLRRSTVEADIVAVMEAQRAK